MASLCREKLQFTLRNLDKMFETVWNTNKLVENMSYCLFFVVHSNAGKESSLSAG